MVTGAPGSGKSTVLQYVAWTLARALRAGDAQLAADRLGFVIPKDKEDKLLPAELELPLPIFILSTLRIGVTSAALPVKKTSSAM